VREEATIAQLTARLDCGVDLISHALPFVGSVMVDRTRPATRQLRDAL